MTYEKLCKIVFVADLSLALFSVLIGDIGFAILWALAAYLVSFGLPEKKEEKCKLL